MKSFHNKVNNLTKGLTPENYTRSYANVYEHRGDFSHILSQLTYQHSDTVQQYYKRPVVEIEATYLIQLPIPDVADSLKIFGDVHPNRCIPLILTVNKRWRDLWCSVPKGVKAMYTRWGKYEGYFEEGFHLLLPGTRISWIVTEGYVPFDITIKLCPTLDNVMVKIDIMIVFRIVDCAKFVFNLGPYKLNDIFCAFLEESIRSLARSVTYDEVYELRGKNLESMKRSLNEKLMDDYGVEIEDVNITNVMLPLLLQDVMQRDTGYESKENCQKQAQSYGLLVANNTAEGEYVTLSRKNESLAMEEEAKRTRLFIAKECDEIIALNNKRLAEIQVEGAGECERIKFESESKEAEFLGEKEKLLATMRAEGSKTAAIIKAEADAYAMVRKSKAMSDVANLKAQAITIVADAEAKHFKSLEQKRKFELLKKRTQILEALANNKNVVVTSNTKDDRFQIWSGLDGNNATFRPILPASQPSKARAT